MYFQCVKDCESYNVQACQCLPSNTDKGCQKSKPIIKTHFRDLLSFQIPCTYVIPSCKIRFLFGQFLCKNHRQFVGEYPTHNFFLSTQVFFFTLIKENMTGIRPYMYKWNGFSCWFFMVNDLEFFVRKIQRNKNRKHFLF